MAKKEKNKNSEAEKLKAGEEVSNSEKELETSTAKGKNAAEDSKEESAVPAPTKSGKEEKAPFGTPRFIKLNRK